MRNNRRLISNTLLAAAVVPLLALVSVDCRDNCTGQPTPYSAGPANVRFVHAATDIASVDFSFDSTAIVHGARFNTFDAASCCYRPCAELGPGVFRVQTTNGAPLTTTHAELRGDCFYTVVLLSQNGVAKLLVLRDTMAISALDSSRIRLIHAVDDLPSLDAYLAGRLVVRGLNYGTASEYVTVHQITFADTGGFIASRSGEPRDVIVELPSGKVFVPGNKVMTIIVLGKAAPNGAEPLATLAVFGDNFASVNGQGDALPVPNTFGALRLVNVVSDTSSGSLALYDVNVKKWRADFPANSRIRDIYPDSASSYFLFGFSPFDRDLQGRYRVAVIGFKDQMVPSGVVIPIADSVMIDPFEPNNRFTCFMMGAQRPFTLIAAADTIPTPPAGRCSLRFVNASPDGTQQIDVSIRDGAKLFSNVAYTRVTESATISSRRVILEVKPTGSSAVTLDTNLLDGSIYSLVASGTINGNFHLSLLRK